MRHKGSHSCGLESWGHVFFSDPVKGQPLYLMMETDWVSDTTCLKKNPRWWTTLKISHIYCNTSLYETFTDEEKPLSMSCIFFLMVTSQIQISFSLNLHVTARTNNATLWQIHCQVVKTAKFQRFPVQTQNEKQTTLIIQESWARRRIRWVCIGHVACQKEYDTISCDVAVLIFLGLRVCNCILKYNGDYSLPF